MSPGPVTLTAGANAPVDGGTVTVTVTGANLDGVAVLAVEGGHIRPLTAADALARVTATDAGATVTVAPGDIPAQVERLRVVAWSGVRSRPLVPAAAVVAVDGDDRVRVDVGTDVVLRAAELLQLYRRHDAWKVRAVASGWEGGLDAMAAAMGVPAPAFAALAPARGTAAAPDRSSPPVGPEELRRLVDQIVGPGPRTGDSTSLRFALGGLQDVRVVVEPLDDLGAVTAVIGLGPGEPRGRLSEAALRTSGAAPMGRIAFEHGQVFASASTTVARDAVDTALLKALLTEAWGAAVLFVGEAGSAWSGRPMTPRPPRELRLGIVEDLAAVHTWAEIHGMLRSARFLPLADAPEACLLPEDGTLWLGPVLLSGMSRAWSVVCERVLRSDVSMHSGGWDHLASLNTVSGPMRIGAVRETGIDAPWAVVLNFNALQVQRGQPQRDLNIGLGLLDEARPDAERMVGQAVGGRSDRNNLPWPAGRRWRAESGPAADVLAREVAALPADAPPPAGLLERIRIRRNDLDRDGTAYVAHLVLAHAERGGRSSPWVALAREVVALAPVHGPGAPSATASLHVRLARLTTAAAAAPAPDQGGAPAPPPRREGGRRRRWFGG